MNNTIGYEQSLDKLDKRLRRILNHEIIDQHEVDSLQRNLDEVASLFPDEKESNKGYKLYEIQAYIHFLKDEVFLAEKFIARAEELKGHRYYDSEVLFRFIDDRLNYLKTVVVDEVKKNGLKEMFIGFAWFIGASIVTAFSYNNAAAKAATSSEDQSYTIFYGAMIVGFIGLIRGIYLYIMSRKKAEEIMDTIRQQGN